MRFRATVLLFLLLPFLGGCWDRLEVNDLAIVDLVGVDKVEAGVKLTVSVVVPTRAQTSPSASGSGGGGGGRPAVIFTAEGASIMNAMARLQQKVSRRLFWAHTRVLVVGEGFARDGIRPALDYWSRHREPRLMMQIAITPGDAADFIQAQSRLERLLSEAVREIINLRMQTVVTMKEFLGMVRSETEEPIAPRVEATAEGDVQVNGTAVFRDDRLIGWLTAAETRGLLWLRGEIVTGVATVEVPSGGMVSMMLIRGSTRIRPDFRTGRLRMIAEFEAEDDVYESTAPIDLGKAEAVEVVQELLRKEVEHRIRTTLEKVQNDLGVDILMFGDAVRRGAPLRWEGGLKQKWPKLFPEVPVDIIVRAHVRRTGEHSAPLSTEEGQIKSQPRELLKKKKE